MSITDNNDALITVHNEILVFLTKMVALKDQNKPWISAIIKHNILKREINYDLYRRNLLSQREYKSSGTL